MLLTSFVTGFRLGATFSELSDSSSKTTPNSHYITGLFKASVLVRLAEFSMGAQGPGLKAFYILPSLTAIGGITSAIHSGLAARFKVRPSVAAFGEEVQSTLSLTKHTFEILIGTVALAVLLISRRYDAFAGVCAGVGFDLAMKRLVQTKSIKRLQNSYGTPLDLALHTAVNIFLYKKNYISGQTLALQQLKPFVERFFYQFVRGGDWGYSFFTFRNHFYATWIPSDLDSPTRILHITLEAFKAYAVIAMAYLQTDPRTPWSHTNSFSVLSALSHAGPVGSWIAKRLPFKWDTKDRFGDTILHSLAKSKFSGYRARAMVRSIANSNLNVNQLDTAVAKGTALHLACSIRTTSVDMVKALLELPGVDVNALGGYLVTPLNYACISGQSEKALLLLQKGATADYLTLRLAIIHDCSPKVIRALSNRAGIPKDKQGVYLLQAYCNLGMKKEAEQRIDKDPSLLNQFDRWHQHPLHYAARKGHTELISLFVERFSIDPYGIRDEYQKTPLHWFAGAKPQLSEKHMAEIINAFKSPAQINAGDYNGRTPLQAAVELGNLRLVKTLLKLGASPNIEDLKGKTPLHYVLKASKETRPALLELLQGSAAWNEEKNRRALLHYYYHSELLTDQYKWMELVESKVDLNALSFEDKPILQLALEKKQFYAVRFLLQHNPPLTYSASPGVQSDALTPCIKLSERPQQWLQEILYPLPETALAHIAAEIDQLLEQDLLSLYTYNPVKIAAALLNESTRDKMLQNLHLLHRPFHDMAASHHDAFAWVVPVLEHLNINFTNLIRSQSPEASLAIIAYLSPEKRAELVESLNELVKTAYNNYQELAAAKLKDNKFTKQQYSSELGTVLASKRNLQLLRQLSPDVPLDLDLLNQLEQNLTSYQAALIALSPKFPQEQLSLDKELEEIDMPRFVMDLLPEGPLGTKAAPFPIADLYDAGLCSGVDAKLISLNLKPYLVAREFRRSQQDNVDAAELLNKIQENLISEIYQMLIIANHIGNANLKSISEDKINRFAEIINQLQGKELINKLIDLEQERILDLLTYYLEQPERIKTKEGESLSDSLANKNKYWTTFWTVAKPQ